MQVLKTSLCVSLNKTHRLPSTAELKQCLVVKVRMGKEQGDDGFGKTGVGHMITVSQNKHTVRSDSGWVKIWDPQKQHSLSSPISRLDAFPASCLCEGERQGYFPHTCMKRLHVSVFKE